MTDDRDARRALLISGAIDGDLTASERDELDALRRADPSVDVEIRELGEILRSATATVTGWDGSTPTSGLRDRVLNVANEGDVAEAPSPDATAAASEGAPGEGARVTALRRRPWLLAVGAAACVAVGAGSVLLGQSSVPGPPTGPPGTLGAIEQISFDGEPTGVDIDGSLVAHTWGTETILNITGLTEADPYEVVLVTVAGDSLDSGSFLGSTVAIDCEMNAAVLRESVASVEIQDASGTVVARAQLPDAG
jgi:hypothetical protein